MKPQTQLDFASRIGQMAEATALNGLWLTSRLIGSEKADSCRASTMVEPLKLREGGLLVELVCPALRNLTVLRLQYRHKRAHHMHRPSLNRSRSSRTHHWAAPFLRLHIKQSALKKPNQQLPSTTSRQLSPPISRCSDIRSPTAASPMARTKSTRRRSAEPPIPKTSSLSSQSRRR